MSALLEHPESVQSSVRDRQEQANLIMRSEFVFKNPDAYVQFLKNYRNTPELNFLAQQEIDTEIKMFDPDYSN
ncbi:MULTISPECIES: hypothetical protein [unclassified Bacillus (in: firmicutes)]